MTSEKIDKILKPIERYMHNESTAGIVLFLSALAAVVWSNSPWSASYFDLWHHDIAIRAGNYEVNNTLHYWINDGLMAMFFFVIGLELKREIMAGELSDARQATVPLLAAIGGMVVPALIYVLFNSSGTASNGWGIPMATDIAFAMGIIALLGSKAPTSLKVFLTALAISDDLGAVLVIALFYTSDISLLSLVVGAGFMIVLFGANYLGVRSTLFYGLIGIGGVWLAFLFSGVHATIAGVLAALAIPARTKIDEKKFIKVLDEKLSEFHSIPPNDVTLLEPAQYKVIDSINRLTDAAGTPLQKLELHLHPWVSYLIMPLFALANAGIVLEPEVIQKAFSSNVTLGVLFGLAIGKPAGVLLFVWVLVKLKIASLPRQMGWQHLVGVGLLAGVGFTMSLFITELAFDTPQNIAEAKIGIFISSIISGVTGYFVLTRAKAIPELSEP